MRIVRPLVDAVGDLQLALRNLGRLREVAVILARAGLGRLVRGVPELDAAGEARGPEATTPELVVSALQQLGPTYVKLGQVLSTRPDVLPPAYIAALERLQDEVDAVPFAQIDAILDQELGELREALLAELDEAPIATASIAQVHGAVLRDGGEIVLKVQRPGIAAQVEADLNILRFLLHRALIEYPEIAALDPGSLLDEFNRTMTAELDFRQEAENMRRFARNFADHPGVHVPAVCDALVTTRVLGMERLHGVSIRKARAAGHDMKVVGTRYLDTLFEMILSHGFFHGDLHPGNVLVLPGDVLGLLDCGMVGSATDKMRHQIATMMFALRRGDHRTLSRILYDIAIRDDRLDFRALQDATVEVVAEFFPPGARLEDISMGPFSVELLRRSAMLGARVPTPYIMVLKALITAEGLAKSLLHEVDPIEAAEPFFTRLATTRLAPERLQQEALYAALTISSLVDRLPVTVAQLMDDLDEQRLQVSVKPVADPETLRHAARQVDRQLAAAFAVGGLVAGALVADTLLVATLLLWVGAGAIGLWLLLRR